MSSTIMSTQSMVTPTASSAAILGSQNSNSSSTSNNSQTSSSSISSTTSTITSMESAKNSSSFSSSSCSASSSSSAILTSTERGSIFTSFQTSQQNKIAPSKTQVLTLICSLPSKGVEQDFLIKQAIKIFEELNLFDKLETIQDMQNSIHPTDISKSTDYPKEIIIRFKNALNYKEGEYLNRILYMTEFGSNPQGSYSNSRWNQIDEGARIFSEDPKSVASKKGVESHKSMLCKGLDY